MDNKLLTSEWLILFVTLVLVSKSLAQDAEVSLIGPYLGQTPPGDTPQVFALGTVSTEHRDHNAFFSPDMKTFYFTRKDLNVNRWSLIAYEQRGEQWHETVVGPRVGRPLLAPDGVTMHMGKYVMTRREGSWSEAKSLGPMFDKESWGIMRLSASASGTYVFDDYKSGDVIRISEVKNGQRQRPVKLGPEINTGLYNAHPFIAPDGSYIIWDGVRDSGFGNSDLYISFRLKDGSWGEAINLGDKVNTSAREASASVTPDGKYLFFNRTTPSRDADIFWVDAQVIETLRPAN
ncbi:TolB family protein [Pseudoalteromonas maricaloris]|uniref:PD40 domain-containing protein n=1 Tax=Pseudoalteromonas maricaloris TaxID=184924 RepID=A0A8I2KNH4_9GAMM|nr:MULTISPECIES: PD40 domain-containing protein [Pseudoalteromonas]KID32787.1 hypothetical protein QT15_20185 [Pseudoalteromonas flavipulchra NCIMB 2033 = ATCC BAA-314]MBD0780937.1 hypothetical protein [Pseudoalteromonas flavipulchra]MBE0373721.1 hypothetical protein [Pseudoalteromonas flavipulchra NCIMB 2033 = ATCC BAA-314]NLR19792.1 hypothetical protein [Pseudoalteromonas maricaloris]WOX27623.1 PD40 domain-containing protein [Pseudoalteromonas maricaloris]